MKETRVATRYARALLDLALERGELERIHEDMQHLQRTISENPDFKIVLKSPIINTDKKHQILHAIFEDAVSQTVLMFMDIITTKKREAYLYNIAASFISLYRIHKNIVSAVVTSAIPLEKQAREQIHSMVKEATQAAQVVITENVDPSIIGGIILRVGDRQIDASVENRLNELKKEFSKNQFIKGF